MSIGLIILLVVVGVAVFLAIQSAQAGKIRQLEDAIADARQAIDRLGGQVYNLTGKDDASRQALTDASERFNAASSQISQAASPAQARLAKQTAIEGLYYIRAARSALGMDPGPNIPELRGQRSAGAVSEERTVDYQGRKIHASPHPSRSTPNYYPGGVVAGRPVPAGWYSEPWWKTALIAGAWGVGSLFLFDALFSGMPGVTYDEQDFGDSGGIDPGGGFDGGFDF